MKKIIICFLLICNIGLWANPLEKDSLKNDSIRIDSAQTENVYKTKNTYLTGNDFNVIADKVVEKMEQEHKGRIAVITKKIVITTGEIIISVLILILGVVVWFLYKKIYKKLKDIEYQSKEDSQVPEYKLTTMERKVDETAKNVEKIKKVVVDDFKPVIMQPVVQENNVEYAKDNLNENIKNEPKTIYAKPLGDGNLKTTTEASEAIYIISVNKDNTGKFSLYENESQKKRAIKNKDNMLDLFCNAKGSSIGAETIKIINEGKVKLLGNNIWEVTQKADIEFVK